MLEQHGDKTWLQLIAFMHTLPEWIAKGIDGVQTKWAIIHLRELAEAVGYNEDKADAIEAHEQERMENAKLMQALGAKPAHV